ncbi:MAG TPA: Sec-independent protein translocase protein TatB [Rhodanobacteraceae bacterium]|nr:Sec-independent protein translocase protein TatB [Rhodanobacteraceae bacterium]
MFDVSFGEILLIAVVALVVLGPERLPGAARTAGALLRRVRRGWDSVRAEVMRELEAEELRAKLKEAQEAARAAVDETRKHASTAADALGSVAREARERIDEARAEASRASAASPNPEESAAANNESREQS